MALDVVLNKEKGVLEFSNGEVRPIPDSMKFDLLGSQAAKDYEQEKLKEYRPKYSSEIGTAVGRFDQSIPGKLLRLDEIGGEFLENLGRAWTAGKGQEKLGFYDRYKEASEASSRAQRRALEEGAAKNPISSTVGSTIGFAADVAATLPFGAGPAALESLGARFAASRLGRVAAGPFTGNAIIGAAASDKNPLTDPMGVAQDAAIAGGIGKALSFPMSVASQRAGARAAAEAEGRFAQTEAQRLAQHGLDTAAYESAVAGMPAAQEAAQRSFSQRVLDSISSLGKRAPADSVPVSSLRVGDFIDGTINASAMAGTKEGNALTKFLTTVVEARPENLKVADIGKIVEAVEERLIKNPSEAGVLTAFKQHLYETVPHALGGAAAQRTYSKRILRPVIEAFDAHVGRIFSSPERMKAAEEVLGSGFMSRLRQRVVDRMEGAIFSNPAGFNQMVQDGSLSSFLVEAVKSEPMLLKLQKAAGQYERDLSQKLAKSLGSSGPVDFASMAAKTEGASSLNAFKNVVQDIENALSDVATQAVRSQALPVSVKATEVADLAQRKFSKTLGMADVIAPPQAPAAFVPGQAPQAFQPRGVSGWLAEKFENPNFYGDIGSSLKNIGKGSALVGGALGGAIGYAGLGKVMSSLPVLAPVAAGVAGMRGLTRPTAGMALARGLVQKAGVISAIDSLAMKYPSFSDGVIADPNERLQASADIERNHDLDVEDKAVMQMKINRGQPLFGRQ